MFHDANSRHITAFKKQLLYTITPYSYLQSFQLHWPELTFSDKSHATVNNDTIAKKDCNVKCTEHCKYYP